MRVLSIVQVRVGSTRLPGKALLPILGKPMFLHTVAAAPWPNIVAVPTTDKILMEICADLDIPTAHHHPAEDVLGRFMVALDTASAHYHIDFDWVLRLTADCPMLTLELVTRFLNMCYGGYDVIYTNRPLDPDGLDIELFSVSALRMADKAARDDYDREHVTTAIYRCSKVDHLRVSDMHPLTKVSVDTADEYRLVKGIMEGKVK